MTPDARQIQTNLLGAEVTYLLSGGGRDTGTIRAVYLTPNGSPMLLVQDASGNLVRVSHDSVRVAR